MTVGLTVFRVLASCTSLFMLLSPIPSILQIVRAKSTGVASIVPFVAMLTNSHSVMLFGYLSKQYSPVFSTFVVGDVLALAYISIFYYYTDNRAKAHRAFAVASVFIVLLTTYAILGGYSVTGQSRHGASQVLGYVTMFTTAMLYTSPLERIGLVLRHRSAVFFNIYMIYAGTINNVAWIVYSVLARQWLIFAPVAFSCVMGLVQIVLYWIFHPRTHPLAVPHSADLETGMVAKPTQPTGAAFRGVASPS